MGRFIARRVLYMVPTLLAISIVSFLILELPPGDFVTSYVTALASSGQVVDEAVVQALRRQYGLDQPLLVRYLKWIWNVLHGDFGMSFDWNRPVAELIGEKLALTVVVSVCSLVFAWIVAFAVGIFSALRQYSFLDYFFTFLGFLGLSVPDFTLALVLMYVSVRYLGVGIGLFSAEYADAPWSLAKVLDMLTHMWVPVLLVAMNGTASLIRVMRANLLDELGKPYVETARAKGLSELRLTLKYPVRIAVNPLVSQAAFVFPQMISGSMVVSVVLGLPTTGPLFLRALQSQDMYLAGGFILLLGLLTAVGTLISDILLAWLDPRIRYE